MKKLIRKIVKHFTNEETRANRILAMVFIALGIFVTWLGKDATVSLILITLSIGLLLAKENWTMF